MRGRRSWAGWVILGGVLLAAILIPFFLFEDAITQWAAVHLAGGSRWLTALLIVGLLASDIFLPVPSSIVSTSAGALLGFAGGVLASTLGMCGGSMLGYWVGAAAGESVLRRFVSEKQIQRATALSLRYGTAALLISRPIPVLAEASVVLAGMMHVPRARFLLLTTLSNLGISAAYCAVGAWSNNGGSFLFAFAGAIAIPAIAIALAKLFRL